MNEKDYDELSHALNTNYTGLDHIDKHVYLKMFGYKSLEAYYEDVSMDQDISNIKVPTFAFGAIDDQLCGNQFIPFADIEAKNSNVFLCSSAYGAHACHLTGTLTPRTWYQMPFMEFLNFMEGRLAPAKSQK